MVPAFNLDDANAANAANIADVDPAWNTRRKAAPGATRETVVWNVGVQ